MNSKKNEPASVKTWVGRILLMCIPIVNIVFLIRWVTSKEDESRKNFAIAQFIMLVITFILTFILTLTIGVSFISLFSSIYSLTDDDDSYSYDYNYDYDDDDDYSFTFDDTDDENNEDSVSANSNTVAENTFTGDLIANKQIAINGQVLTLSETTATEVENLLGIQFDNNDMHDELESNYYTYVTWDVDDDYDCTAYFYFYNPDDSGTRTVADCVLYKVRLTSFAYSDGVGLNNFLTFNMPGNITESSSIDDIFAVYSSDYDYDYEGDYYHEYQYYSRDDAGYSVSTSFEVMNNGQICEVCMGY
jgi:hypothetical protein